MTLQIIPHPLDARVWTLAKDGRLITAMNGETIAALHAVFRHRIHVAALARTLAAVAWHQQLRREA